MRRREFLLAGSGVVASCLVSPSRSEAARDDLVAGIETETLFEGRRGGTTWFHPRPCLFPQGDTTDVFLTLQSISGSDVFGQVHWSRSSDTGKTWPEPTPIDGFGRRDLPSGHQVGVCDVVPGYHPKQKMILAMGHNVYYKDNVLARPQLQRWPMYATWKADIGWSEPKRLMWDDPRATAIYTCGCSQRVLLNDDLFVPLSFGIPGQPRQVASARCTWEEGELKIVEVGNALANTAKRGLLEPSLTHWHDNFYMTIRAEDSRGYVARSKDGLHWEKQKAWSWDDGTPLTMSTTQQHWLNHSDQLFLVYTRKAKENANVIRWRSPLYMAAFDPKRMCLIKETERVVLPMLGEGVNAPNDVALMGNFHTLAVTATESWVIVGEHLPRKGYRGDTLLARIRWSQPNTMVGV